VAEVSLCELAGLLSLVRDAGCENAVIRLVVDWILLTKHLLLRTRPHNRLARQNCCGPLPPPKEPCVGVES